MGFPGDPAPARADKPICEIGAAAHKLCCAHIKIHIHKTIKAEDHTGANHFCFDIMKCVIVAGFVLVTTSFAWIVPEEVATLPDGLYTVRSDPGDPEKYTIVPVHRSEDDQRFEVKDGIRDEKEDEHLNITQQHTRDNVVKKKKAGQRNNTGKDKGEGEKYDDSKGSSGGKQPVPFDAYEDEYEEAAAHKAQKNDQGEDALHGRCLLPEERARDWALKYNLTDGHDWDGGLQERCLLPEELARLRAERLTRNDTAHETALNNGRLERRCLLPEERARDRAEHAAKYNITHEMDTRCLLPEELARLRAERYTRNNRTHEIEKRCLLPEERSRNRAEYTAQYNTTHNIDTRCLLPEELARNRAERFTKSITRESTRDSNDLQERCLLPEQRARDQAEHAVKFNMTHEMDARCLLPEELARLRAERFTSNNMTRVMSYGRHARDDKDSEYAQDSAGLRKRGGKYDMERFRKDNPSNKFGPGEVPPGKDTQGKGDKARPLIFDEIPFSYDRMECTQLGPELPHMHYRAARDGLLQYCDRFGDISEDTSHVSFSKNADIIVYACNFKYHVNRCFSDEYKWLEENVFNRQCGDRAPAHVACSTKGRGYGRAWTGEEICAGLTDIEQRWKGMPNPMVGEKEGEVEVTHPGAKHKQFFESIGAQKENNATQASEGADPQVTDLGEAIWNDMANVAPPPTQEGQEVATQPVADVGEEIWGDLTNMIPPPVPEDGQQAGMLPIQMPQEEGDVLSPDQYRPKYVPVLQDGEVKLMYLLREPAAETVQEQMQVVEMPVQDELLTQETAGLYDQPVAQYYPAPVQPEQEPQQPSVENVIAQQPVAELVDPEAVEERPIVQPPAVNSSIPKKQPQTPDAKKPLTVPQHLKSIADELDKKPATGNQTAPGSDAQKTEEERKSIYGTVEGQRNLPGEKGAAKPPPAPAKPQETADLENAAFDKPARPTPVPDESIARQPSAVSGTSMTYSQPPMQAGKASESGTAPDDMPMAMPNTEKPVEERGDAKVSQARDFGEREVAERKDHSEYSDSMQTDTNPPRREAAAQTLDNEKHDAEQSDSEDLGSKNGGSQKPRIQKHDASGKKPDYNKPEEKEPEVSEDRKPERDQEADEDRPDMDRSGGKSDPKTAAPSRHWQRW